MCVCVSILIVKRYHLIREAEDIMTVSQHLEAKAWAHDLVSGRERQPVHPCSCLRARARAEAVPTLLWREAEAAASCQRAESCSGLVGRTHSKSGPSLVALMASSEQRGNVWS